jgi:hypothetical protein
MNKLIIFCLILLTAPAFAAKSKNCETSLVGKRPDRKTLGAGAVLQLKPELKRIGFYSAATMILEPAEKTNLYKDGGPLDGGWALPPGIRLRTLSGYKKKGGVAFVEIEVPDTEMRGFMHWIDLYHNALVVEEGAPVEVKPSRAKPAQFPDKGHPQQFETLAAEGKTIYGRQFAKEGDLVWIANHTRIMSAKSVGILTKISQPLVPGVWSSRGMVVVQTLAGTEEQVYHYDCNPISQQEAELVQKK